MRSFGESAIIHAIVPQDFELLSSVLEAVAAEFEPSGNHPLRAASFEDLGRGQHSLWHDVCELRVKWRNRPEQSVHIGRTRVLRTRMWLAHCRSIAW